MRDPWTLVVCSECAPPLVLPFERTSPRGPAAWAEAHARHTRHAVVSLEACPECGGLCCHPACAAQDDPGADVIRATFYRYTPPITDLRPL